MRRHRIYIIIVVLINLDRQRCIEHFQKLGLQNVDALLDIQNQDGLLMQQEKGLITPAEFRDGVRKMISLHHLLSWFHRYCGTTFTAADMLIWHLPPSSQPWNITFTGITPCQLLTTFRTA